MKNKKYTKQSVTFWILKLGVDCLCKPLTHLINKSLHNSYLPTQSKTATITPVPKVSSPKNPAEYRPISLTSILSRTTGRLVIRKSLYPAIEASDSYQDQFAFRPTGETTAAIIAITTAVLKILEKQNLVRVIAFDFSKAFDTVKHASILKSFDKLELSDDVHNWVVIFFQNRTHQTKYQNETSDVATINASVIQGSAIAAVAFTAIASTLKRAFDKNLYLSTLMIPTSLYQRINLIRRKRR